jgi:FkbM family methyltransferase
MNPQRQLIRIFGKVPALYSIYSKTGLKDILTGSYYLKKEIKSRNGIIRIQDFIMMLDASSYMDISLYRQFIQTGLYERETSLYIMKSLFPGDVFVDIGANSGYYSLLASKIVGQLGHVYSFEPHPVTYSRLVRNVNLNSLANIDTFNFGLSSFDGEGELFVSKSSDGLNSLKAIPLVDDSLKVNIRKLDTVIRGKVSMIKIDAEGSELDIIEGAKNTISSSPGIRIIYEMNRELSGQKLLDVFSSIGFESFTIKNGKPYFRINSVGSLPKGTSNLVAVKN